VPRRHAPRANGQAKGHDDSTSLGVYLRDIARLPRLTADEERELGLRIQQERDQAAVLRLVESNLRFVVSYAKRYRGAGVPLIELIHEGNLGLIEAARRFDPSHNVKFISYAVWWIRQSIVHALADQTRAFSIPVKLLAALTSAGSDVSLSEPVGVSTDGRARELGETLVLDREGVDDEMIHRRDLDELVHAIGRLDGREQQVVRLRFGLEDDEPKTLQQVGDLLHLSRERVRQIESRAKDKLRRSERLRSHLN
jgi:RNA polymerase primary sigma factor